MDVCNTYTEKALERYIQLLGKIILNFKLTSFFLTQYRKIVNNAKVKKSTNEKGYTIYLYSAKVK